MLKLSYIVSFMAIEQGQLIKNDFESYLILVKN